MRIGNNDFKFQDVSRVLTVPDCNVIGPNKLGSGHGEQKFYFGSKTELESFTIGHHQIKCFFLRSDLLTYIHAVQQEYFAPSQNYAGKDKMPELWRERVDEISKLPEIIDFIVEVQTQIVGPRGYINSKGYTHNLLN